MAVAQPLLACLFFMGLKETGLFKSVAKDIYEAWLWWGRWTFRAVHAAHSSDLPGLVPACRLSAC